MTVMTSPESLSVLVAAGAGHGDPAGAAVVAADAPGLRAEGPVLHTQFAKLSSDRARNEPSHG